MWNSQKLAAEVQLNGSWVEHFGSLPDFSLTDYKGRTVSSPDLMEGLLMVVFVVEECKPCDQLLNELNTGTQASADQLGVVVISPTGSITLSEKIKSRLPNAVILSDPDYEVADFFQVQQAPSAARRLHSASR